jgi:hypothetical protein
MSVFFIAFIVLAFVLLIVYSQLFWLLNSFAPHTKVIGVVFFGFTTNTLSPL